jgi:hypothetical protein
MGLNMETKTRWPLTYIPYACVSKFLEGEQRDMQTPVEWNNHNNLPHK